MMVIPRVYIDTSVIGGYFDKEFEEWSRLIFDEFKHRKLIPVISDLTLRELELARSEVRDLLQVIPDNIIEYTLLTQEAEDLARHYLSEKIISENFFEDALHIAIATVSNVDILVSWNFKHIVNINRIRGYHSVNLKYGYKIFEIRSPREVLSV
jgi:hypothetical protein